MAEAEKQKTKTVMKKDSPIRSILKAISWRIIASLTTWLIVFVIFRRFTDQTMSEVIENASFITAIEVVAKLIFYYLHERLWTNITWGKYWQKTYWRSRAWKKMYNKRKQEVAEQANN